MSGSTQAAVTSHIAMPGWAVGGSVEVLVSALAKAGGEPRFVGGCVRDSLLGRPVHDIDIATVLLPETTLKVLQGVSIKTVPTGIDHGTVTAVFPDRSIEVTTLRRDVETDGRHATVAFTDDWFEDAARRDFTMNALFLSPDGTLTDFFHGLSDARAGKVRFVGNPADRIEEDYLRVLRYFRFLAHYGKGEPDPDAVDACRVGASGLESLSGERLAKEFFRLLEAEDPVPALRLMEANGCLHPFGVGPTGIDRLAALPISARNDRMLRFMALLSDDAEIAEAAIDRLRLSNADADRIHAARSGFCTSGPSVEEQLYRNGVPAVFDSAMLQMADGNNNNSLQQALDVANAWQAPVFPIKGQDILDMAVEPGPRIGSVLKSVEDWWIENDFRPDREECLLRARSLLG